MSKRGASNAAQRAKNLPEIILFCNDLGLKYVWKAGNWHMRIEGKFDVYPTRKRYHWLPSGERGHFSDYDELGRIFLELMGAVSPEDAQQNYLDTVEPYDAGR